MATSITQARLQVGCDSAVGYRLGYTFGLQVWIGMILM